MSRADDVATLPSREPPGPGEPGETRDQAAGSSPRRQTHARRRVSPATRAIGVLGELLITAGVVIALFVAWQVFWTDVEGERAARTAVEEFEATIPDAPEEIAEAGPGDPPAEPGVARGETLATMHVPRWGAAWQFPVAEGVSAADILDAGFVGHYPDTQMPGEIGNFAVAGHRQTYGRPFRQVEELQIGDPIVVETAQAWYVYRVTESFVVTPDATDVLAPVPGEPGAQATARSITLTTCHPLWSVAERWIVHGELDSWVDRSQGRPAELEGD